MGHGAGAELRAVPHLRGALDRGLLDRTGEFTERVQQRYDDTGLLPEDVQRHAGQRARAAGGAADHQMHAMYDIGNDDLRLRGRARLLRLAPGRGRPQWASGYGRFRSHPDGYDVDRLGTFTPAAGCTVPHRRAEDSRLV